MSTTICLFYKSVRLVYSGWPERSAQAHCYFVNKTGSVTQCNHHRIACHLASVLRLTANQFAALLIESQPHEHDRHMAPSDGEARAETADRWW